MKKLLLFNFKDIFTLIKLFYFLMSVTSLYTPCFVMFCVFLYGPFCHGAHKPDLSTLFTSFFLWTSLPFIFVNYTSIWMKCNLYKLLNALSLRYSNYIVCLYFSWRRNSPLEILNAFVIYMFSNIDTLSKVRL